MIIIEIIDQRLLGAIKCMHNQSLLLGVAVHPSHPLVSPFRAEVQSLYVSTPFLLQNVWVGAEPF